MITVSNADFDRAVSDAYERLPAEFRPYLENVVIEARDRPDAKLLEEHEETEALLGLYIGVPLDEQSVTYASPGPDRILLFRDNIRAMCESRDELIDEIRITLLHEIGHHFGLDEERLEELGYD